MPDSAYLTSGFLSKHLGTDQKFNENNGGIGFIAPSGLLGGYYRNSLDKDSFYLGKEFKTGLLGNDKAGVDIGAILGAVTGYNKSVMPLALPELIGRIGDHNAALTMVPPIRGVTPATVALQYRRRF